MNMSKLTESEQAELARKFLEGTDEFDKAFDEYADKYAPETVLLENVSKLSLVERVRLAALFSEGSVEYEKFLLLLWSNGIDTVAGCSGVAECHAENAEKDKAYVVLKITPETDDLIACFVSEVKTSKLYESKTISVRNDILLLKTACPAFIIENKAAGQSRNQCNIFFKNLADLFQKALYNNSFH